VKNNMVGAAIQMVAFLAHCLPFVAVAAQKTCLVGREALQEHREDGPRASTARAPTTGGETRGNAGRGLRVLERHRARER